MNSENLVQRNALVFPIGAVEQRARELSNLIAPLGTEFVLGSGAIPHVSIYQAAYPPRNEDAVIQAVKQIAATTPSFEITLQGFRVFWRTFVFWDAVKSAELSSLHRRMLDALNPLREGELLPIHEQLLADETIPSGLRESIRQYGNPLCGGEERPHLTLGRLKDAAQADAALQLLQAQSETSLYFPMIGISIGAVGPHGTCPVLGGEFHATSRP